MATTRIYYATILEVTIKDKKKNIKKEKLKITIKNSHQNSSETNN